MESDQLQPFDDLDGVLASIAHALIAKGRKEDAYLLSEARISLEPTGHDNWDGGTTIWSLNISIPYTKYLTYSEKEREELEAFIDSTIKPFLPNTGHWVRASVTPETLKDVDWRGNIPRITKMTTTTSDIARHIESLIKELEEYTSEYDVKRWQLEVKTFLKEALSQEVANRFMEYAENSDVWHESAQQKSFLKAFLLKKHGEESDLNAVTDSKFWLPNHFRLFLSHLSNYKEQTSALDKLLRHYGISGFVAHDKIEPGEEWQTEIENALHSMDALAAILTPNFSESKWTDQEIGVAIGRKLLVIPIKKGSKPHGFISKYQAIDGEAKNIMVSQIAKKIFQLIAASPKTKDKIATALANQILQSTTESDAVNKLVLLTTVQPMPRIQFEKIRNSCKNNLIIYRSTKFIAKLNQILKEIGIQEVEYQAPSLSSPEDDDIPF